MATAQDTRPPKPDQSLDALRATMCITHLFTQQQLPDARVPHAVEVPDDNHIVWADIGLTSRTKHDLQRAGQQCERAQCEQYGTAPRRPESEYWCVASLCPEDRGWGCNEGGWRICGPRL